MSQREERRTIKREKNVRAESRTKLKLKHEPAIKISKNYTLCSKV